MLYQLQTQIKILCEENDGKIFGKKACIKWPPGIKCLKTDNNGKELLLDKNGNLLGEKGMGCVEWVIN
jgi:hypothetical protein